MQTTYGGAQKYSFLWDCFFITILFVTDVMFLGIIEQPILCLTRIGYLYFLFDRSASPLSKIMAGIYVFLLATIQSGFLDRELIVLLCFYSIVTCVRPLIQMSSWLWIFFVLFFIISQHVYITGMGPSLGLLAWTVRLVGVTLISSIFCLWLGRKVGRAIA